MKHITATLAAAALFVPGVVRPAAAASCEQLAALTLPDTTIARAEVVPAGAFTPPATAEVPARRGGAGRGGPGFGRGRGARNAFAALPAFCRVSATVTPTPDSQIHIEVWLPAANWNGRFQASGGAAGANSAVGGGINYPAMAASLRAGFATAGTDNGHEGATLSFAPGHPEKLVDYGYRATHEMTLKAKALIEALYGSGPKYSYWSACAAGGRQGLQEAQRFPADYDGIVVWAPANNWTRLQTWSMWVYQVAHRSAAGYIPPAKYAAIHQTVVAQCDALDGVKDGIIENPARCHPKLYALLCEGADTSQCLTPAQLATAQAIYSPPVNPRTHATVYPAMPPGSELGWGALAGPNAPYYASETFKYVVFDDPAWTAASRPINLDADLALMDRKAGVINATNPDLSAFFARGGKLIQYHGWTDPLIAPGDSVNYYTSVAAKVGRDVAAKSYRLFMVPGMNHCRGGEGADTIDMQPAIENWVERGQAPATATASKLVDGRVDRTHLLCPYPQEAVYKGSGSINDASSFECRGHQTP
jgi:feruloyl esterase